MSPSLPSSIWVAGCGYTGRILAELLTLRGSSVLGITRSTESAQALQSQVPFPVRSCDLASPASVACLAQSAGVPQAIVHCASSGHQGASSYRSVYLDGCRHLLAACPGSLLLFTSSTSVYPQTSGEQVTEISPANPALETSRVLREAEDCVLDNGGIVARLSGIYGPGRSYLLQSFLAGTATLEPPPSRFLNQIHRQDIVSALLLLLQLRHATAGQIYNVSDGNTLTQRSCYEALSRIFQRPLPPEAPLDPVRKRAWTNKRVDCDKLRALRWTPGYPSFLDALHLDPSLVPSIQARIPS